MIRKVNIEVDVQYAFDELETNEQWEFIDDNIDKATVTTIINAARDRQLADDIIQYASTVELIDELESRGYRVEKDF